MALTRGLSKLEYGDIAGDGGVATSWTEIGLIDADSTAALTQADATETLFMAAQSDQPVDKDVTPGALTLNISLLESSPDKLLTLMGGSVTGSTEANKVWSAPLQAQVIYKSWKITPKKGKIITIVKGQLSSKINFDLQKTGKFVADVSIAVLLPDKAATAPISVGPEVS
jgi:hypothetical protein